MLRRSGVVLLVGLLTFASPVLGYGGTLGKGPSKEWAVPTSDRELHSIRGGAFGVAFSLFFDGFVDDRGDVPGALTRDNGGAPLPPLDFSVQDGQASVRTVVGNFDGASGIFQINQVPGSLNVVHNNLFIQITLITVPSSTAIPSLLSNMVRPLQ